MSPEGSSRPPGPRRPPRSGTEARSAPRRPPARPTGVKAAPATKRAAPAKKSATKSPTAKKKSPVARSEPAARKRVAPEAPGPREPRRRPQAKAPARAEVSSLTFREGRQGPPQTKKAPPVRRPDTQPAARIRSERAPRTGWESITGRTRAVVVEADELLPPTPTPATAFRQRYGVVYNTQGPRMRLAVLWVLAVVASIAYAPLRPYGLAVLYGVAAGLAAQQVVDAARSTRAGKLRWVAALGASSLPVVATVGTGALGVGLLVLVVVAVVTAITDGPEHREMSVIAAAGNCVLAAGVCGGAAAALVLLAQYEIGALIILMIYLMVYDASDYIVGSGASNGVEGPLAGGLFIAATTTMLAVTEVPPFRGADVWSFAMLAAVACPAGQILASAMLPRADAFAPALRRLDSMLIVAPAWAGLIGLYLQQVPG